MGLATSTLRPVPLPDARRPGGPGGVAGPRGRLGAALLVLLGGRARPNMVRDALLGEKKTQRSRRECEFNSTGEVGLERSGDFGDAR